MSRRAVIWLGAILLLARGTRANENWGKHFSTMLNDHANNALGVADMQKYLDTKVTYLTEPLSGSGFIRELSRELSAKLEKVTEVVKSLQRHVESTYANLHSIPQYSECQCNPDDTSKYAFDNNLKKMVNKEELCFIGKGVKKTDSHFKDDLVETMKQNYANNPALKWQYVGTEDGVLHIYPASVNCQFTSESYDPRLRPWYVQTATNKPKDVVLVVDRSYSMHEQRGPKSRMEIARDAAKALVDSLSPNDNIAILQFHDIADTPQHQGSHECYKKNFAKATPQNKDNIKELINQIQPKGGGTSYIAAMTEAFLRFQSDEQSTEERDKVIVFVTDGKSTDVDPEKVLDVISEENSKLDNVVVIMTYYLGEPNSDKTLLKKMAFQTKANLTAGPVRNGTFTDVSRPEDDLRKTLGRYYDFFYNKDASNDPIISVPYYDGFGLGVIASMCLGIYPNNDFKGVVCVDITISDVLGAATFFRPTEASYAFIVDDRGRLMTHPLLPRPRDYTHDPIFVDMLTIENEREAKEILSAMLSGERGSKSFVSRRVVSRGDLIHDGVISKSTFSHYFWEPVEGTNYTVCIVLSDKDKEMRYTNPVRVSSFSYHRLDLLSSNTKCDHFKLVSTLDKSVVKLTGSAFRDPARYFDKTETTETVTQYEKYFTGQTTDSSVFLSNVRGSVAVTEQLDKIWLQGTDVSNFTVWRYIGTLDGVFRIYPGSSVYKEYDHTERPWYQRAVSNKGALCLSPPYQDAYGAGVIMTLSTVIYHGKANSGQHTFTDPMMGVMGLDFTTKHFFSLVSEYIPECNKDDKICFVMDNAGYLVFHEDFQASEETQVERSHIISKEPDIANYLITKSLMNRASCEDLENIKNNHFWKVQISESKIESSSPAFVLYAVEKSNVYFGIKNNGSKNSFKGCTCRKTPTNTLEACVHTDDKACECPCCSRSQHFNYCQNSFSGISDSLPPCVPPPPTRTTVNNASIASELPVCYFINCQRLTKWQCDRESRCIWCERDALIEDASCRPSSECQVENAGSLSGGAIAGIILGILIPICVIAIVVVVLLVLKRRRPKRNDNSYNSEQEAKRQQSYNQSISNISHISRGSVASNGNLIPASSQSSLKPRVDWTPQPLPRESDGVYHNPSFNDYEEFSSNGAVTYLPITDISLPDISNPPTDDNPTLEVVRDACYIHPHSPNRLNNNDYTNQNQEIDDDIHYEVPTGVQPQVAIF